MGYHSREELEKMNFKHLGKDVMISTKANIYQPERFSIGDYSRIDDYCVILGDVTLGAHVHITMFCHIGGGPFGVTVGDFVSIGCKSMIITHSDDYSLEHLHSVTVPNEYRGGDEGPIEIKQYSMIGTNALIMPDVTIGEGVTVGANSIIKHDLEEWHLYAGFPLRKIRENSKKCIEFAEELRAKEKEIGL
ncbi:MAG: hypothetical protein WBH77_07400 [Saccharofermentanales bacterium]